MEKNITTLTFFDYNTFLTKVWAFSEMGIGRLYLQNIPGLLFVKQLGTGAGVGFSLKPNFSRYALLAVWKSEEDADNFFSKSEFIQRTKKKSFDTWTIKLQAVSSRGTWEGKNPFVASAQYSGGPICVLTRATINFSSLLRFWKHVPLSSYATKNAKGLIFSIGIGELPWIKQATFSVWENMETMKTFAYTDIHKNIVSKTKNENWYSEDLFARFEILDANDSWKAKNLIKFQ